MGKNKPIGIFDSGLGGLTVAAQVIERLPKEDFIYLGDTARVPYGTRSKEVVERFARQDTLFLLKRKVKCIVVACNTVSALALREVKNVSNVPVFDAITPVAKSLSSSKTLKIGVIGTRGTIGSNAYKIAIKKANPNIHVFELACPLLVPAIEEGEISGNLIKILIGNYLSPLKKKKINALVLGCTHYPIIKKEIRAFLGPNLTLIDPAQEIAKTLSIFLSESYSVPKRAKVKRSYFVTDLTERFIKVAEMFLGQKIKSSLKKVDIESL